MTSPSKYTIQLLEGIHDDAQRHDLAHDAARLLGTNAEQLEQLLARGVGARIARAGSEKRAEHVAGLLRSVGVSVEVVAPQDVEDDGVSDGHGAEVSASMMEASFEASTLETPTFETPTFETPTFETGSSENDHPYAAVQAHTDENITGETSTGETSTDEAGSTWWLPTASQADHQTVEQADHQALDAFVTAASTTEADPFGSAGDSDPFGAAGGSDPFDSVIGAASITSEDATTSSSANDPFSTLLPSDESASWTNPNDQPSAPWLNASALSANASAVPFDAVDSFSTQGASDPFGPASASDPFASAIVEHYPQVTPSSSDPFAAPMASSDPFSHDPFAAAANSNDPFGPADDNDPFGPAGGSDPFSPAGGSDPFGPTGGSDPFGAASDTHSPSSSTATVIRNDPFAAPIGAARDPFSPTVDPFAAPGGDAFTPVISLTSTSELPPQAKAARDRAPRRSSIQTKTIIALVVPMLLVVAGVVGFLAYQLPITISTLLRARATAIAAVTAESLRPNFDRGDVSQANIDSLSGLATGALQKVPFGAFFMIEHEARDIRQVDTIEGLNSADVIKFFKDDQKLLDEGGDPGLLKGKIINIAGTNYVAAAAPFTSSGMMGFGKAWIFAGLKTDPIGEALRNTLIPILVAIGITLLLALAIGTGLARSLLRPIIAATQQANRISLGDLDRTVPNTGNDEIGDLLTALEQMRISLKSMVARLRRDRA
jgi:HAMP domain-containing protein